MRTPPNTANLSTRSAIPTATVKILFFPSQKPNTVDTISDSPQCSPIMSFLLLGCAVCSFYCRGRCFSPDLCQISADALWSNAEIDFASEHRSSLDLSKMTATGNVNSAGTIQWDLVIAKCRETEAACEERERRLSKSDNTKRSLTPLSPQDNTNKVLRFSV